MLAKLLSFWVSIPLAILLGLLPGVWAAEWWEHQPVTPKWVCINVLFIHWCPVTPLLAQRDKDHSDLVALLLREEEATNAALALQKQQAALTQAAAVADARAQTRIQTVTRTLIKEVPAYVDSKAVADCSVPVGFVRLFNAAVSGVDPAAVPGPAGLADDAPSGVGIDTVARVAVDNLGSGLANAQQLSDLQAWVRAQQAANPPPPGSLKGP